MEVKKDPSYSVDDDNISSAEGQLDVASAAYRRIPKFLRGLGEDEIAQLNKKLVRKIYLFVLSTIGILYILNYIDRQNLASAKLRRIADDLNMTTEQFSTAINILFVGYLPFQIPSNLLITKISRPGMYICAAVAIWVVSLLQLLVSRATVNLSQSEPFLEQPKLSSSPVLSITCLLGTRRWNLVSVLPGYTLHSRWAMPLVVSSLLLSYSSTVSTVFVVGDGISSLKAAPLLESASSVLVSCQSSRITAVFSLQNSVLLLYGVLNQKPEQLRALRKKGCFEALPKPCLTRS